MIWDYFSTIIHRFPNENFYLRPHPLEKIDIWQENFSRFKNVKISKDGNINEQLWEPKFFQKAGKGTSKKSSKKKRHWTSEKLRE